MAIVTTDDRNYTNIANAIRTKSGTATTYKPASMANAILNIPAQEPPELQEVWVTPTGSDMTVEADDDYDGLSTVHVRGDNDLIADNIKDGVTIYGTTGTYAGTDTSDATALPKNILTGKTAYISTGKVEGTLALQMGVVRPDAEKVATLSSDVKWIEDLELTLPAYSTSSQTLRAATAFETTVNLNMSTYNYFVVERMLTIPSYNIATDAKGKQEYLLCSALYEIVNFPGGTFSTLSGNKSYATQQNTLYTVGNAARIVYWSSNTAITAGTSAAYGCSTTVSAPTISSTNTTSPVLTIMFPALIMRGHASYLSSTYWGAITDVRTQFIADVYRIPKDSTWGIDGWGEQSQIMHILDCIDTTNHDLT